MGSDVGVGGRAVAVGGTGVTVGVGGLPAHPEIINNPEKIMIKKNGFCLVSIPQIILNNKKTA
jgi:hypothetical protein